MPSEKIGEYEIEYSGVKLSDSDGWAAYVAIYGNSSNPMHRNAIVPSHRVSVNNAFPTEDAATKSAREIAISLIKQ